MTLNPKLDFLEKWAAKTMAKSAFVDPSAAGMPPGGAPPMDPAMMGMPPGGAPPMDPAMMGMPPGGAPPMDPAMMGMPPGGTPPMDPSVQMMADQEMMRNMIREEIQKTMGGDGGQGIAAPAKKGNKVEDALAQFEQRMTQKIEAKDKMIVAALRQAGIEISLADMFGIDGSAQQQSPQPSSGQPGLSEILSPGGQSTQDGSSLAKVGELESDIAILTKLADTRKALQRSVLGRTLTPFDARLPERTVLAGLYR
jgi:hypothetical protein